MWNDLPGHDEICPLCGVKMDALAGNLSLWPVGTCTAFAPGILKYYCQRCIGGLVENALIVKELSKMENQYGRLSCKEPSKSLAPSNEGEGEVEGT